MKIKGYVVRWTDETRREYKCDTITDAVDEWASLYAAGCTDVRILAVAEDGTETPLPTYEEALAALDAVRRTIPEEHSSYTSPHLAIAAILGEYDGALATLAALRAEIERQRQRLAKVFGGEAVEASHGDLVSLAADELTEIADMLAEAGVEARGPDDALPARVGRLIADANEREEHGDEMDDVIATLRTEIDAALAWHRMPFSSAPNHPPDLAGCPTGTLHALRRMLGPTS